MIKSFVEGLFPSRKRVLLLVYIHEGNVRFVIEYPPNDSKFVLEKRESATTAARFILSDYFHFAHSVDFYHAKSFEHDKVEYQIVEFAGQVMPNEDGTDGLEEMIKGGYKAVLLGDHPLSPKIKKILG